MPLSEWSVVLADPAAGTEMQQRRVPHFVQKVPVSIRFGKRAEGPPCPVSIAALNRSSGSVPRSIPAHVKDQR